MWKVIQQACGSIKSDGGEKAPVLWTIQCEEVEENVWQHRGMIRDTMATQSNK